MIERGEFAEADFPLDVTWETVIFLYFIRNSAGISYRAKGSAGMRSPRRRNQLLCNTARTQRVRRRTLYL